MSTVDRALDIADRAKRALSPTYWSAQTLLSGEREQIHAGGHTALVRTTERMEHRHARDLHRERDHIAWLCDRLDEGDLLWDVGAHVGSYALLAADAGARVAAVEADPALAHRLRANVRCNPALAERITVREVALAAPGTDALPVADINQWAGDGVIERQVAVSPAGLAAATGPPDAIKCDIEGGEGELMGALGDLLDGVNSALIEVHDPERRGATVLAALKDAGLGTQIHQRGGEHTAHVRARRGSS